MSKTQQEGITPAAGPLQRSYGVVAVSQKYQNLKIGDGYVIAGTSLLVHNGADECLQTPPYTRHIQLICVIFTLMQEVCRSSPIHEV